MKDVFRMMNLEWHPKLKDMILAAWIHTIHRIWIVQNETYFFYINSFKYMVVSNILALLMISSNDST